MEGLAKALARTVRELITSKTVNCALGAAAAVAVASFQAGGASPMGAALLAAAWAAHLCALVTLDIKEGGAL